MLNQVILMGRLTADPELRTTTTGISVTSFTIAVDRDRTTDGNRKTDFICCAAWRQTAEFICKYFQKGRMIAVRGKLQKKEYTDKAGTKHDTYEVVVDNVNFCGDKMTNAEPMQPDSPTNDDLPF